MSRRVWCTCRLTSACVVPWQIDAGDDLVRHDDASVATSMPVRDERIRPHARAVWRRQFDRNHAGAFAVPDNGPPRVARSTGRAGQKLQLGRKRGPRAINRGLSPSPRGPLSQPMVVQKFGGTSVADPDAIRRLIEIVRTARTRDGAGPAVVVSAMSGVTDSLLKVAADAAAAKADDALAGVAKIRDRHLAAARELAPGNAALEGADQRAVRSAGGRGPHAGRAARAVAEHVRRRGRRRRASQLAAGGGGPAPRGSAGDVGGRAAAPSSPPTTTCRRVRCRN